MSKRRRVWPVVIALPATLLLLAGGLFIGGAQSGFTASLTNSTNKVGTGTAFLTAKQGAKTLCSSVPAGTTVPATSNFECSDSLVPDVLYTSGSKVTTLTNGGTQKFDTSAFKLNTCSPQVLVNTKVANNAFVSRGDLGWSQPGVSKLSGSGSMGFTGTTAMGSQFAISTAPQTYSVAAWFKTSVAGGGIFGYASSFVGASATSHDRELFLDSSGNLSFYTYVGGSKKVTTSGTNYADNSWHFAVAVATGGTGAKIELYVDNTYIGATSTGSSTNSSEGTNGYWRVGQNFGSTIGGNGNYFTGNISNTATFSSALTAANVATLWSQSTQSGYASAVNALPVANFWPMNDAGTATVSNATTIAMGSYDPCLHVNITVSSSTECVYPAQASCPAVGSSSSLAALISAGAKTFTSPAGGASTTLTVATAPNSSWNSAVDENIDLLVDDSIINTNFPQTFHWSR